MDEILIENIFSNVLLFKKNIYTDTDTHTHPHIYIYLQFHQLVFSSKLFTIVEPCAVSFPCAFALPLLELILWISA